VVIFITIIPPVFHFSGHSEQFLKSFFCNGLRKLGLANEVLFIHKEFQHKGTC
jgi:hypothetical protein